MEAGEMKVSQEVEVTSLINGNDQSRDANDDYDYGNENDFTVSSPISEVVAAAASSAAAAIMLSSTPFESAYYMGCKRRLILLLLLILLFGLSLVLSTTTLLVGAVSTTFNVRTNNSMFRKSNDENHSNVILDDDDDVYFSWVNSQLRWQPATNTNAATDAAANDNNCIPLFRLANSTIHCGYAGISPLTNTSFDDDNDDRNDDDDRQLCGGVPMEQNYCVLPSEGSWIAAATPPTITTTTTLISSDKGMSSMALPPLPRRLGMNRIYNDTTILPRCKTMGEFTNGTYEGVGFDLEWVPLNCSSVPLSPFVWTQHTKCQATITMIGDSHIRNLFTATVNGLRGIEFFAEAHADEEMKGRGVAESYEWRMLRDGTATDRFAVYSDTLSMDPRPFEDCPCDEVVIKCLRIAFIWAPTFQGQLDQIHFVMEWKSDVVIVEPGNAYESSSLLSTNWTAQFDQLLETDGHLRLGILHFPWGKQPQGREAALNSWIHGAHSERKSYALQSAMYPPGNSQGRKTFHFACGLGKVNALNDNIKAVEPCSDLSDTAHIRALITIHFDALTGKT